MPSATDSGVREDEAESGVLPPVQWRPNLALFLMTAVSVFVTAAVTDRAFNEAIDSGASFPVALLRDATLMHATEFTVSLLAILLAHEFGHYIAARIHRVDATLPFFIPLPILSPFGTMGAVIRMRGVITTRKALLDIGASGPIAGLVVAIPVYLWGLSHSHVVPASGGGSLIQLGESIALRLLDKFGGPQVPAGMDLELSPAAFAGWAGMFVTMLNLIPVGQLDGGHVAYSLFGPRQNKLARWAHQAMLAFFFVSLGGYLMRDIRLGIGFARIGTYINASIFWLLWFELLAVLGSLAPNKPENPGEVHLSARTRLIATIGLAWLGGLLRDHPAPILEVAWFIGLALLLTMEVRWGSLRPSTLLDHPPTDDVPLDPVRRGIAIITLALFALLFMPVPMTL